MKSKVNEKYLQDLVSLPKEEIIEVLREELKYDHEKSDAHKLIAQLVYSGVLINEMMNCVLTYMPEKSRKDQPVRTVLFNFLKKLFDNHFYMTENIEYFRNPENFKEL